MCQKARQFAPPLLAALVAIMSLYEHTRNGIIKAGFDPEVLEDIAKNLSRFSALEQAVELYHKFEVEAEKLPWPQDSDFGAIVLQVESANANELIAQYMLSQAIKRAQWCATCATSGGEGLARSIHIKELESELSKYN